MTYACEKLDTVYHYCDLTGFQGILASKELWFHDAYFSHDYTEHRLILEKAVAHLRELANQRRNSGFCAKLEASLLGVPIHPYVCCLSSQPDLLSQWRAYSDDGAGFAIGFSTDGIDRFSEAHLNRKKMPISFQQVEYDPREQQTRLKEVIAKALARYLREFVDNNDADLRWEGLDIATAHSEIWSLAAVCKNDGFCEESEHRLVLMPKPNDSPPPGIDVSDMRFRPKGRRLVPYLPVSFEPRDIVAIRLGPRNHQTETRQAIELFLWKTGFDVRALDIANSAASYGTQ